MLDLACRNTRKLVRLTLKEENIRTGRFFTKKEAAKLMASSFIMPENKHGVYVLDPGAGTGILSAAIIEELCKNSTVQEIYLTCYENNEKYLPMLKDNLERIRKKVRHDYHVKVKIDVREQNFVLESHTDNEKYDYIIANPPQELIVEKSMESFVTPDILSAPNVPLCTLFLILAVKMLAPSGELISYLPSSCTTSVYLAKFRAYLFEYTHLDTLFVFERKNTKDPIQKQVIVKLVEGKQTPDTVQIKHVLETKEDSYSDIKEKSYPYKIIVTGQEKAILVPKDSQDSKYIQIIRNLPCSFKTFHLKVHTGLTIEARHPGLVKEKPEKGVVPFLHPKHLQNGMISFPLPGVAHQYLLQDNPKILQPAKNMLLIKRAPSKSDKRRLMCSALLRAAIPTPLISTSNKLNYIDVAGNSKTEMDPPFLFGLLGYLSSEAVDEYYKNMSSSGQINAKELEQLPLPQADTIRAIGSQLLQMRVYKADYCDRVVRRILFGEK